MKLTGIISILLLAGCASGGANHHGTEAANDAANAANAAANSANAASQHIMHHTPPPPPPPPPMF